jgi:hypothetical protein
VLTPVMSSGWGPTRPGNIRDLEIGADRTVGANLGRLNTDMQARSDELNGVGEQIKYPIIDHVASSRGRTHQNHSASDHD